MRDRRAGGARGDDPVPHRMILGEQVLNTCSGAAYAQRSRGGACVKCNDGELHSNARDSQKLGTGRAAVQRIITFEARMQRWASSGAAPEHPPAVIAEAVAGRAGFP